VDNDKTGGPAFPVGVPGVRLSERSGMDLRDFFAAHLAGGSVSGGWGPNSPATWAADMYRLADALVAERAKRGGR
jgi:hypothetical protein